MQFKEVIWEHIKRNFVNNNNYYNEIPRSDLYEPTVRLKDDNQINEPAHELMVLIT